MRAAFALVAATLVASAKAHFTLNYPSPRGPFNDENEIKFCDGYNNVNTTRQPFPLTGGVIAMYSAHPDWNAEVILSTSSNPQNLSDFNTTSTSGIPQLAVPKFQQKNAAGVYCLPIDIANLNLTGAQEGSNVTIQVVYNGGDDILFQCADLTLTANATIPSNSTLQCKQAADVPVASAIPNTTASGTASSSTSTSPAGSSPNSKGNSAAGVTVPAWMGVLGLGVIAAFAL